MGLVLGPKARAAGYRLNEHISVGSTNAEALALAGAGDCGRIWVVSTHQTAGRGRRGRPWATPPGNLAATVLMIFEGDPKLAATLGFVAGLSLHEALIHAAPTLAGGGSAALAGSGRRLRLKWPNDVLLDGRKLAGILLEAETLNDQRLAVVVGIGVNVTSVPDDMPYPVVALTDLGIAVDAAGIFGLLTDAWAGAERVWDNGRGFEVIRRRWLDLATGVGEAVAVRLGGEVFAGVFETIDGQGRLVIRAPDGARHPVSAGEVHFGEAATARP